MAKENKKVYNPLSQQVEKVVRKRKAPTTSSDSESDSQPIKKMLPMKRELEVPKSLALTLYNGPSTSTSKMNNHNLECKLIKKKKTNPNRTR